MLREQRTYGDFFFLICIYLAVPGLSCDVGSGIWFSDQGSNPGRTLHCKHRVLATGPLGSPIWGFILPECVRKGLTEVVILEERGRISRSLNGRVGKAGAGGMVKMFQGRKWQIKRQRGKIKKAKRNKRSQVKKKKKTTGPQAKPQRRTCQEMPSQSLYSGFYFGKCL